MDMVWSNGRQESPTSWIKEKYWRWKCNLYF
ncbi:hypothetical protein LINPERHAP2_LOCUS18360 [Linum perenne]